MKETLTQGCLAEILDIIPIHLKNIEESRRIPPVPLLFQVMESLDSSINTLVFPERERTPAIRTDGLTERGTEALARPVDTIRVRE